MNPISSSPTLAAMAAHEPTSSTVPQKNATEEAFQGFVGETFFGLMLKALRTTSQDVAYFDGGQAEDMFRQQLDQTVSARLAETHGEQLAKPLYEQFRNRLDIKV